MFRRSRTASTPEVEKRIRTALDGMRPLLRVESFAVELIRYQSQDGVARLRVEGGCPDCNMTAAALVRAIEAHLRRRVPEVSAVEAESPSSA